MYDSKMTAFISITATCTFEDGSICGYTHEETSAVKFKWARGSGQTSSVGTGPGFDHTLGTSSGTPCCILPPFVEVLGKIQLGMSNVK